MPEFAGRSEKGRLLRVEDTERREKEAVLPGEASPGHRAQRVLALFSGPAGRWDGLGAYLREWDVLIDEVDVVNRAMINVVDDTAWEAWKAKLHAGEYYFLFCGTPCEIFSHARQVQPGPPPLRSVEYPRGIPTLSGKLKEQVRMGNLFVCRTTEACAIIHGLGGGFAVENPKRWGAEPSLFAMEEIVELARVSGTGAVDLDQCCFGAIATKPTTLLYLGALAGHAGSRVRSGRAVRSQYGIARQLARRSCRSSHSPRLLRPML